MTYAMPRVAQTSGHTIHASHIEAPRTPFYVEFDAPAYANVLLFEAGKRWVRALAETAEGALSVCRYHYFSGSGFRIIENPQA
jgi:hypothetical protein